MPSGIVTKEMIIVQRIGAGGWNAGVSVPADQVERWPSDVAVHRWQVFTGRAAGIKLPVNRLSEATIAKGHPSLDLRRQFPQTRAAAVRV
jgi:hypothetical protein